MVPILLVSFFMWVLIFNRVLFLRRLYVKNISRHQAGEFVQQNRWPDEKYQGANSLLVRQFLANRSLAKNLDGFILDETVLKLISSMDKYLAAISVLSAVAPLLGLLGTVVGMMETFDVITRFGKIGRAHV